MTFKKLSSRLYAATTTAKIGERTHRIDIRIDGRDGDYRVDRLGMMGYIWEAIDGGRGFSSVASASAYARMWLKESVMQQDLCPYVDR